MQLEALLQQPEELANFVQYMKSINCSTSMTALLLMFELVNNFANNSVSEALCARLRVPLHQLLLLLHCGRVIPDTDTFDSITRPLPTQCSDCQHPVSPQPQLLSLLNMPATFTHTIQKALSSSDPLSIARLVNAPEWISSYTALRNTFQSFYLPAYLESVNYLERKFAKDTDKDDLSGRAAFEFLDSEESDLMEITNTLVSQRLKPTRKSKGALPQSNSFTDLKELTGRQSAGSRPLLDFFRDDLMLDRKRTTAGRKHSLPRTNPPKPPPPPQVDLSTALFNDEHDDDGSGGGGIDFADWSVSVPSYCRPTADRSHYPLLEVRTPRGKNFNQVPMNSSALDLSLLNFTPSRQGFFLVQSERGEGEMRMVICKVHRFPRPPGCSAVVSESSSMCQVGPFLFSLSTSTPDKISIEESFGSSFVIHPHEAAFLTQFQLSQNDMDAEDFVLRSIHQRRQDDSFVHFGLCAEVKTLTIPDGVLHTTGGDPVGHLVVDFCAAKVDKSVHDLQLAAVGIDVRCIVGSVGWRLVHEPSFLRVDDQAEIVTSGVEEVHTPLRVLFCGYIYSAVVVGEKFVDGSCECTRLEVHPPTIEEMATHPYLIDQPFLRSSELLFAFLTSPMEFTSNILPDISLGRLVKSFPLRLAKEKGQFVDNFLLAFRASCLRSETTKARKRTSDTPGSSSSQGTATTSPGAEQFSALEHRLRSRHYWNNAGISLHQRRVQTAIYCSLSGSYIGSFYDLFGYLFDSLWSPNRSSFEPSRHHHHHRHSRPRHPDDTFLLLDLWHWLKGLFTSLRHCLFALWCGCTGLLDPTGLLDEEIWGDEFMQRIANPPSPTTSSASSPTSSIPALLRRTVINLWLRLGPRVREVFNLYTRSKLAAGLRLLVQNNYMAPLLLMLRVKIFWRPSAPLMSWFDDDIVAGRSEEASPRKTDSEKAERRKKVSSLLRKFINRLHLQWLSEDDMLQWRFERVFELFQHPKWNKQLTYILLDNLLLELFPDVFSRSDLTQ
nr:unnamed protein product [Spirometra erinaceieuropaei]